MQADEEGVPDTRTLKHILQLDCLVEIIDFKIVDGARMYKFVWREGEIARYKWVPLDMLGQYMVWVCRFQCENRDIIRRCEEEWTQMLI